MTPTPDTIAPAARADLLERIARAAEYRSTGARAARPTTKPEPPPRGLIREVVIVRSHRAWKNGRAR